MTDARPDPAPEAETPERDAIYEAALAQVPFEGMNDQALAAAERELNLPAGTARLYFPGGGAALAAQYHRRGDRALRDWLRSAPPGRIRDRIAAAIWQRLELADPELVRAGAAVLALPQNAALSARLVWETSDAIWEGLGDGSRDVNWYSKRVTLSAVWSATVLFWLGDTSEGKADTRAFIDRRIEGVMRFEKFKAQARKLPGLGMMADLATGWVRAPGAKGTTEEHGA